jgi:CBS domain-containing membrane protein
MCTLIEQMPSRQPRRFFAPLLPGASTRDRLLGIIASFLAIAATGLASGAVLQSGIFLPFLLAPMGATAVLLFAIPSSPLAQPWPVIGGNSISALVGTICAMAIPDIAVAAGIAVAAAIALMSFTRSLHPPGGAMALTAVLASSEVSVLNPLMPAALNSTCMVLAAVILHRMMGRTYPHKPTRVDVSPIGTSDQPAMRRFGFNEADLDTALSGLDLTVDVSREDLKQLVSSIETAVAARARPDLRCRDIMSRDIISLGPHATAREALSALLERGLRTIPVVDEQGLIYGTVGLRELANIAGTVSLREIWSEPVVSTEDAAALELAQPLLSGKAHAVVIVDNQRRIVGMISQTDLLAALMRIRAVDQTAIHQAN